MLVKPIDLNSVIYSETITKITRGNTEIVKTQILAAECFVRSYMSQFDNEKIFGTEINEPTFKGSDVEMIKHAVKTVAAYLLIRLSAPNVHTELFKDDHDSIVKWLESLQNGDVTLDLPRKPDNPDTPQDESLNQVFSCFEHKRTNHF